MDRVTFSRRRRQKREEQGWPSRPLEAVRSLNKLTTIWRRLPGRAFPVTVGKQASIMQTKKELYATDTGGRPLRLLLLLLVVVPYCLLVYYYTGGGGLLLARVVPVQVARRPVDYTGLLVVSICR